jgi:dipeptidyl aminopeptidase/acylaminoacyl peptidase
VFLPLFWASVASAQVPGDITRGPVDSVGPQTLNVLTIGFRKLQKEPFVGPKRIGIYGFSRGEMAASLLAIESYDVKAAVFGAGIDDYQHMYDEVRLPGIRENMRSETHMTRDAVRIRSSILRMDRLRCPVWILRGEVDENQPDKASREAPRGTA